MKSSNYLQNKLVIVLFVVVSGVFLASSMLPASGMIIAKSERGQSIGQTLQYYQKEGYAKQGPLYVTVIHEGVVKFRDHDPVSYQRLTIIDEHGAKTSLVPVQRVYLLKKNGLVVLVKLIKQSERTHV